MTQINSVSDVLKLAIQAEEESYAFYDLVAKKVRDTTVREIFTKLAKDELGHKEFLLGCLADAALLKKVQAPADYKVAEATPDPTLSVTMKPADAIALAMKKEQRAAEDYRALARATQDPQYKQMFEKLVEMELGHKAALENAFVNIGYPEVF